MKHFTKTVLAILLLGCITLGATSSCNKKDNANKVATATDSIKMKNESGEVSMKFEYPTDSTSALSTTINEYLSEQMGGTYDSTYNNVRTLVSFYLNKTLAKNKEEYNNLKAEMLKSGDKTPIPWQYSFDGSFEKIADTTRYITYTYTFYEYQGGAHGTAVATGQTFRKADGRRIGWDVFTNTYEEDFQKLIKDGLKTYWKLKTDEELKGYLLDENNFYLMPLPQCPPLFTKDGVRFIYGQYEIAPYAAGMPDFTVPYNKLEKFMKVTAKKLL